MVSRTFFELCLTLRSVGQLLCPSAKRADQWSCGEGVGENGGGTLGKFPPRLVYSA